MSRNVSSLFLLSNDCLSSHNPSHLSCDPRWIGPWFFYALNCIYVLYIFAKFKSLLSTFTFCSVKNFTMDVCTSSSAWKHSWCDQVKLRRRRVYETQTFNRKMLIKWITMLMFIANVMPIHLHNGHTWDAIIAKLVIRNMQMNELHSHSERNSSFQQLWSWLTSVKSCLEVAVFFFVPFFLPRWWASLI